jgi:hypothetical protein
MKKLMCLVLGLALIGGIVLTTGCGSSGGGGFLKTFGAILLIAAIASTAGTGGSAAVFAASVRERPRAAIVEKVATTNYFARVYLNGALATQTSNLVIGDASTTLELASSLSLNVDSSIVEYKVEFWSKNGTKPLFVQYGRNASLADGQTTPVSHTITATETAYALSYEYWKADSKNAGKNPNYTDFSALASASDIAKVVTQINNELSTLKASGITLDNFKTYTDTTYTQAQTVATSTAAAPTTTANTYSISGSVIAADGVSKSQGTTVTLTKAGITVASATTGTDGAYAFTGLANGDYVVTPAKSGHTFTPSSQTLTVNGVNLTASNFQAAQATTTTPQIAAVNGATSNVQIAVASTIAVSGTNLGAQMTPPTHELVIKDASSQIVHTTFQFDVGWSNSVITFVIPQTVTITPGSVYTIGIYNHLTKALVSNVFSVTGK